MSREENPTNDRDVATQTAPGAGSDAAPSPTASNGEKAGSGREANGRFAKGNPCGPGNPFARRTAALRRELLAAVTDDDIRQVAKRLVQEAKTGDVAAAKLLLSYTIGTPAPAPDPDTLDQHEWQILHQQATRAQTIELMSSVPLDTACAVARLAKPALTEHFVSTFDESWFGRYWPKTSSISAAAPAPSTNGGAGASPNTPRDRDDRRQQVKKTYGLKGGKLCQRDA